MAAVLAVAAIIPVAGDAHAQANPWGGAKGSGRYADVNGIKLYYETQAPRRRSARRGLGWFRASEVETRHSSGSDALQHLQRSGAGGDGHPVPRRPDDAGALIDSYPVASGSEVR